MTDSAIRIGPKSLGDHFKCFAEFNDPDSKGVKISFRNTRRWLMLADILGGPEDIKFRDVRDAFQRIAKKKERIDIEEFCHFLELLARRTKIDTQTMVQRLKDVGMPSGGSVSAIIINSSNR